MNWFFLTLIAPFLYSTTNHIDKVLHIYRHDAATTAAPEGV